MHCIRFESHQYGITSFGDECALKGSPEIFTRVLYYVEWIKKNSQNDFNS